MAPSLTTPSSSPIPVPSNPASNPASNSASSPAFSTGSTSHTSTQSPDQTADSIDLDDIFTSPSTAQHSSTIEHPSMIEHPSDSPRLRGIHATAGYRDGASAAREAAVQGGFDEGFLLGAALGVRVGLLVGIVEGAVGGEGSVEVRVRARKLLERMRGELALENVLGPGFVAPDGTWGWDVPAGLVERGGVDAVAEMHPLIRRYAGIVGRWVRVLDLRRLGEGEDGGR